jgi:nucleoside-diphosphate-sugar epimerase
MAQKSRILIIGGTGYIGKFIVEASAKAGHPTFALVRESTLSDPVKGKLVDNFKSLGVTLLHVRASISARVCVLCFAGTIYIVFGLVGESVMV